MKKDLYIIAAGKGSRMNNNLPKALTKINNIPNLTNTLQSIGYKFENVFVITNNLVQNEWNNYFQNLTNNYSHLINNVKNISINSGLGDGHAIGAALMQINDQTNDDIVICWGDVFFQYPEIIDELCNKSIEKISGIIPGVRKENPYVTLLVDSNLNCMSADFSKYGENHTTGFHDQSIFRFQKKILFDALIACHAAFWKNGRYITPGGEFSLLHTFHFLYNIGTPLKIYETDYPTKSFNTVEEVLKIEQEL